MILRKEIIKIGLAASAIFCITVLHAQNGCSTLGQTPSTAFPVCGVDTFFQASVPVCGGKAVPVPGCNDGTVYTDLNPYWYRFTCYSSGTLAFLISPEDKNDDYDWQIFDITNRNPDDIYTDPSMFVSCNWSGRQGNTGASAAGTGLNNCAGTAYPLFSTTPNIIQGHEYLLLISHFDGSSQSGYDLSFSGGTANITDPIPPDILSATANCEGTQLRVNINKKMRCASLASGGSDFKLSVAGIAISSATGEGCSTSFDMDSIVLNLSAPLPPGIHQLIIQTGTDGNTILDNCGTSIVVGRSIDFTVYARQATPFDSLAAVGCAPKSLKLIFKKNIKCSSIAANGSDFIVAGPFPVTVSSANGVCSNGLTNIISVNLSSPIVHEGTYTIQLRTGIDGNTILDECGEETPAGATLSFTVKDTVSADFTYLRKEGCEHDTLYYFNNGGQSITSWNWSFDNTIKRIEQNPFVIYSTFGNKTTQLIVSNGFCSDTALLNIPLNHDPLIANFSGPAIFCPDDIAQFSDSSIGNIVQWFWSFGNGNSFDGKIPPIQTYPSVTIDRNFPVRLIVQSNKNCFDTLTKNIKVAKSCFIAVPGAFTPNGDGLNDYLYPLNGYFTSNLLFRVYNRYGQLVFETKDWTRKWNGTVNNIAQASGVYAWYLQYTSTITGQQVFQKGTTVLIR